MKTYNKLIRIKYNDKLYDIFSDENHKKVFLEVRVIDGEEKYFYISVKDYLYLNSIYNVKPNIYYYQNDNNKNKKEFAYKLFIIVGSSIIIVTSIFAGSKAISDIKLSRDTKFISASFDNENNEINNNKTDIIVENETDDLVDKNVSFNEDSTITNNESLEETVETRISFNDVRKTLDNNEQIPEKYRLYIEEYIDCVEERLPNIDLSIFNENIGILRFEITQGKPTHGAAGVVSFSEKYDRPIYLYSEYDSEQFEKRVIFHELTHILRTSYSDGFRVINYGYVMGEAFTEIIAEYLLSDNYENYFDEIYRNYESYDEYAKYLYQILKLLGDEYTLQDYFDYDVLKLEECLKKYCLEEFIDLYDCEYGVSANIEVVDKTRSTELEKNLIELRIQQELKNGTEKCDILSILNIFDESELEVALQIYNNIKNQNGISGEMDEVLKQVTLFKNLYELQCLKQNGASDHEIYQRAQDISSDFIISGQMLWEHLANFVLNQQPKGSDWTYRINEYSGDIVSFDGNKYINCYFKIYQNNEIIYEGYEYNLNEGKFVVNIPYVAVENVDNEFRTFIIRVSDTEYLDYFTGEKLNIIPSNFAPFSSFLSNSCCDYEINLDTFLESDMVLEYFGIKELETNNIKR